MTLLQSSSNTFNSIIPPYPVFQISEDDSQPVISVSEDSHVLNLVLHLLYMIPCSHFCPSVSIVSKVVSALKRYGVSMTSFATPGTCLYDLILSRAPLHPIELYALSAEYELHDLAVAISSHLISFKLATLTDEIVTQIGPSYLKRLFFLHLGRNEALKKLLIAPPTPHDPTPQCGFVEQQKLSRAWGLATAYLVWDARPGLSRRRVSLKRVAIHSPCCRLSDLSTTAISSALDTLQDRLSCQLCQNDLKERVKEIIVKWSKVKVRFLDSPSGPHLTLSTPRGRSSQTHDYNGSGKLCLSRFLFLYDQLVWMFRRQYEPLSTSTTAQARSLERLTQI